MIFYRDRSVISKGRHEKLLGSRAMDRVSHMAQLFVANQR